MQFENKYIRDPYFKISISELVHWSLGLIDKLMATSFNF